MKKIVVLAVGHSEQHYNHDVGDSARCGAPGKGRAHSARGGRTRQGAGALGKGWAHSARGGRTRQGVGGLGKPGNRLGGTPYAGGP